MPNDKELPAETSVEFLNAGILEARRLHIHHKASRLAYAWAKYAYLSLTDCPIGLIVYGNLLDGDDYLVHFNNEPPLRTPLPIADISSRDEVFNQIRKLDGVTEEACERYPAFETARPPRPGSAPGPLFRGRFAHPGDTVASILDHDDPTLVVKKLEELYGGPVRIIPMTFQKGAPR